MTLEAKSFRPAARRYLLHCYVGTYRRICQGSCEAKASIRGLGPRICANGTALRSSFHSSPTAQDQAGRFYPVPLAFEAKPDDTRQMRQLDQSDRATTSNGQLTEYGGRRDRGLFLFPKLWRLVVR